MLRSRKPLQVGGGSPPFTPTPLSPVREVPTQRSQALSRIPPPLTNTLAAQSLAGYSPASRRTAISISIDMPDSFGTSEFGPITPTSSCSRRLQTMDGKTMSLLAVTTIVMVVTGTLMGVLFIGDSSAQAIHHNNHHHSNNNHNNEHATSNPLHPASPKGPSSDRIPLGASADPVPQQHHQHNQQQEQQRPPPIDVISQQRRDHVKSMMSDAWAAYSEHAFGFNELKPVSRKGHSPQYFGSLKGASLVDALDTLILMNMTAEVAQARSWIEHHLTFDGVATTKVSTFEVCIRFLGGLLSAFALTGDVLYKHKALDLGRRLIPAFNTKTGIPMSTIDLATGATGSWSWAPGGCSILSEIGTMSMEFIYLSRITGDDIFASKVNGAINKIFENSPHCGLFPNYIHPDTGLWGPNETSVGALGDSFYEYLFKTWVLEGKNISDVTSHNRFVQTMEGVNNLVHRSKKNNLYIAETKNGAMQHKMGHLACFMGGLYALSADDSTTPETTRSYLEYAAGITETCHNSYIGTRTGLGPEEMQFGDHKHELSSPHASHRYYILRPETVESYFYLWRRTKDPKYREWAWEVVQALEMHARCGKAFCGIKDVNSVPAKHDDVLQSFFFAETLKYLYLIFCDDDVLPLQAWVLNTEAHPLPILMS